MRVMRVMRGLRLNVLATCLDIIEGYCCDFSVPRDLHLVLHTCQQRFEQDVWLSVPARLVVCLPRAVSQSVFYTNR
jgi:hypothetical protein